MGEPVDRAVYGIVQGSGRTIAAALRASTKGAVSNRKTRLNAYMKEERNAYHVLYAPGEEGLLA